MVQEQYSETEANAICETCGNTEIEKGLFDLYIVYTDIEVLHGFVQTFQVDLILWLV